ncbi:hypothetical protein [Lactococcus lactis]|uniref:hypothetical protein n=1 Tax=Lactococcus lactis TaxID=1358 RepID=UPI00356568C7
MSNIYKCKKCGIPFFHCNSCKAWHSECICVNGQRQIIYDEPEDDEIISIEEYPSQVRYYAKKILEAIGENHD